MPFAQVKLWVTLLSPSKVHLASLGFKAYKLSIPSPHFSRLSWKKKQLNCFNHTYCSKTTRRELSYQQQQPKGCVWHCGGVSGMNVWHDSYQISKLIAEYIPLSCYLTPLVQISGWSDDLWNLHRFTRTIEILSHPLLSFTLPVKAKEPWRLEASLNTLIGQYVRHHMSVFILVQIFMSWILTRL